MGRWSEKRGLTLSALYRCSGATITTAYPGLPRTFVTIWEKRNGPVRAALVQAEARAAFGTVDSLYCILDRSDVLSADDLLAWAHVAEVTGGFAAPAVLFSRALQADPARIDVVFWKLSQWLETAPPDSAGLALSAFRKGALHTRKLDTMGLQYRLADFYERHTMYGDEVLVLQAVPETRARFAAPLCDLARRALSRHLNAEALSAASGAYSFAAEPPVRSAAAEIACHALEGLRSFDSALAWLDRAGLTTENRRIEAVVLDQVTGKLSSATSLIARLPPDLSRDTLALRQRLFEGDQAGAAAAVSRGTAWAQAPGETVLWTARTLLFTGDIDRLSGLLDSSLPDPSWRGAQELQRDRYMVNLLQGSNTALAAWPKMEYNLFIGRYDAAEASIAAVGGAGKIPLLLRVLHSLLEGGKIGEAEGLFERQGDSVESPEYLYLRAETLLRLRPDENRARAQPLLKRIIQEFPDDVFSEKARVLLAGAGRDSPQK
jgi:hypothetical protein